MTSDALSMRKFEWFRSLDALRNFAFLSGVVLHATMAFLPNVQLWIIRDRPYPRRRSNRGARQLREARNVTPALVRLGERYQP